MACFVFLVINRRALCKAFRSRLPFLECYIDVFLCVICCTSTRYLRFDYVFFYVYSFTKCIIFVTEACLFTNTMVLEHASLHQRTMHCSLLACGCLLPFTFHFEVIHRLPSNHTPPTCWRVSNRRSTIGDGLIQHKTLNAEWWFLNNTHVYHGRGGSRPGFFHCDVTR